MPTWGIVLLVGGIPLLIGSVFLAIAAIRGWMTRGWMRTMALVVDRRTGRADGGMPAQYPTFRWKDATGRVHQRTSWVSQSLGPAPGARLPARYDPRNPSRAILDTFTQSGRIFYLIGGVLAGVGVIVGVAAAIVIPELRGGGSP